MRDHRLAVTARFRDPRRAGPMILEATSGQGHGWRAARSLTRVALLAGSWSCVALAHPSPGRFNPTTWSVSARTRACRVDAADEVGHDPITLEREPDHLCPSGRYLSTRSWIETRHVYAQVNPWNEGRGIRSRGQEGRWSRVSSSHGAMSCRVHQIVSKASSGMPARRALVVHASCVGRLVSPLKVLRWQSLSR